MRIAMIISTPFPPEEGIGYYTYNLSKKLMEMGHEVTVITRGSLKVKMEVFDGIKIIKVQFWPLYPFHVHIHGYFINKLFKSVENEFDLVHIHTPLTPKLKTKLPMISTIHGSMVENVKAIEIVDLKSLGSHLMTKFISIPMIYDLINNSNVVTIVSKSVENELKKNFSIKNLIVIGNAVDEKKFIPLVNSKKEYLLYVGRLSYGKGLNDLIESAKNICKQYDLKLCIVGKGELEKGLKKQIKKLKLENHVKFLGNVNHNELVHIYQNASIFIFPSHYEGFPTVVLEAMSSALPVIVSDIPAHKAFIEDGKDGFLVNKGSPNEITEKIILLNENKHKAELIGLNARRTIENKYTWNRLSEDIEKIYKSLIR